VGPYQILVGLYPFGSHPVTLNAPCDDFYDEIYFNETWAATVNPLTPGGVQNALFGPGSDLVSLSGYDSANAYQACLAAAYLTSLFGEDGQPNKDEYSNNSISFATWRPSDSQAQSNTQNYDLNAAVLDSLALTFASHNLKGGLPGWEILTPNPGSQPQGDGLPQEFVVHTATPEPATLALLGSGVLAMGLILRRKRASNPLA
jgi:hypothetical protein